MFRAVGGFVGICSALLCVGVVILGFRSRSHADVMMIQLPGNHLAGIAGDHGGVLLAISDLPYTGYVSIDGEISRFAFQSLPLNEFKPLHDTLFDDTLATHFSMLGFKGSAGQTTLTSQLTPQFSAILIPCWALAILFAISPLGVLRTAWVRRRRKRDGLCLSCGYDVRASTGVCPECGTEIPDELKRRAV